MNGTNTTPVYRDKETDEWNARKKEKTPRRPKSPPVDTAILRAEADAQVAASQPKSRTPKTSDVSLQITPVAHAVAVVAAPTAAAQAVIKKIDGLLSHVFTFTDKDGKKHDHSIRTVMKDGEVWFVALDVCKALGIKNSRQATSRLDGKDQCVISNDTQGFGEAPTLSAISYPGMLTLVNGSRKAEAEPLKRFITHDVMPTLHKTGSYGETAPAQVAIEAKPEAPQFNLNDPAFLRNLLVTYTEKTMELQGKLDETREEAKGWMDAAERMTRCNDSLLLKETARFLACFYEDLRDVMLRNGWLNHGGARRADRSDGSLQAGGQQCSAGYMQSQGLHKSPLITPKGRVKLAMLIKSSPVWKVRMLDVTPSTQEALQFDAPAESAQIEHDAPATPEAPPPATDGVNIDAVHQRPEGGEA